MDVIQGLESLFEKHAPETLMALLGRQRPRRFS
jgi:hypothetical protein